MTMGCDAGDIIGGDQARVDSEVQKEGEESSLFLCGFSRGPLGSFTAAGFDDLPCT